MEIIMNDLLAQIQNAAREAGAIMLSAHNDSMQVELKPGHANFVTEYDKRIQSFLMEKLGRILPEARFLGEEDGLDAFREEYENGYLFVIDPIDGTTNFIHNLHPSVTSIGLMKDGKPYAGVVYCPWTDQMFYALKGEGAYENGRRLHSSTNGLEDSIVLAGTAGFDLVAAEYAKQLALEYLGVCAGTRSMGCAEYALCMVASGRAGMYYEMKLHLWDYITGGIILEEAGGRMTDMYGKPLTWRGTTSIMGVSPGIAAREDPEPDPGYYLGLYERESAM